VSAGHDDDDDADADTDRAAADNNGDVIVAVGDVGSKDDKMCDPCQCFVHITGDDDADI